MSSNHSSLAEGCFQFKAKFRTLMIEETLSATNFRFMAKIQRKSVLCSNEMLLNRPQTFDRIFIRTFDERLLEQITKFAEFHLHYFCTILQSGNRDAESLPFLRLATKARTDKVLVTMASSLCVYICATSTHVLRLESPCERLRTSVHTQAPTPCFCPNQGAAEGVLATHFPSGNYIFDHKCAFQKAQLECRVQISISNYSCHSNFLVLFDPSQFINIPQRNVCMAIQRSISIHMGSAITS